MTARLVLIGILFFVAMHMSSCFLKPRYHVDDHRGVYKDLGMTPDQRRYLDEIERHEHPHRYARRHKKEAHAKNAHKAKAHKTKKSDRKKDDRSPKETQPATVDTSAHIGAQVPSSFVPNVQPAVTDTSMRQVNPVALPAPSATPADAAPATPSGQPPADDKAAKKYKKKKKKSKQKDVQQ